MKEHPALKNLFTEVVSGKYGWDRWGLLGILSDYVLNYVDGDIIEIGCGESSIYFSTLAEKYNRRCYHVEYSKSGVENMTNTQGYFGMNSDVFRMTSNEFFNSGAISLNPPSIALAFIDGDHSYGQAKRDYLNIVHRVVNGGYIFLHDTLPPDKSWIVPEKCGKVYKLRMELEAAEHLEVFSFDKSAFNVGLTMVRKLHH